MERGLRALILGARTRVSQLRWNGSAVGPARIVLIGAGEGNRTIVTWLGTKSSTIELHPRGAVMIRRERAPRQRAPNSAAPGGRHESGAPGHRIAARAFSASET